MRRATAALVLAAGLGLSACSSDDGGETATDTESSAGSSASAPASSEAAASPSADETEAESGGGSGDIAPDDVKALALTAEAFPAPYEFTELPPGALEQGNEAISGALSGATFEPAECAGTTNPNAGAQLAQSGFAIGVDQASGSSLAAIVSPVTGETPDFTAQAEKCREFTFNLDQGGMKLSGDASVELLEAPDVDADSVQAASTTLTFTGLGEAQSVRTVVYSAELRGVLVVVTGSGLPGQPVDTAVFDELFEAAVAKVNAA